MTNIPHIVTIEGKKYSAMLPDIYADIKTVVGIEKAPENDNTDYAGKITVSKAVANGDLVRITCRLANKKEKNVLCVAEKFTKAMGGLLPKKINNIDIKTTRIPRRRRLR